MIRPFRQVLDELESTFQRLEDKIPSPQKVAYRDGFKVRYKEKTVQQAVLQKFARYISGLYAINLLLSRGFCQEVGVIQRTLDDIEEDICFIAFGIISGDWTDQHKKYLEYFWWEESGVGMVPRQNIRAYIHRTGTPDDPSTGIDAARTVFKAYSGYVHASSIATIDMCAGDPPRFHLAGMLDNPLYSDHVDDAWNPFYRGLVSACFVAKVFDEEELWQERYCSMKAFEAQFENQIFPVSGAAD